MQVQATVNLGTNDYASEHCLLEGEAREVPADVGTQMVRRGHAVDVTPIEPPRARKPKEDIPEPKVAVATAKTETTK